MYTHMRYAGGHRHPGMGNRLYQNQNRPVYHKILVEPVPLDIDRFKLEICQYDTYAPAQGHPQPHAGILQKMKLKKGGNSHNNWQILP